MKLKKDIYVATENIQAFYKSEIKEGSLLYPLSKEDKPIRHNGKSHCRFVFDTIKGAKAHDSPKGNKRVSIWAVNGILENCIK